MDLVTYKKERLRQLRRLKQARDSLAWYRNEIKRFHAVLKTAQESLPKLVELEAAEAQRYDLLLRTFEGRYGNTEVNRKQEKVLALSAEIARLQKQVRQEREAQVIVERRRRRDRGEAE